MTAANICGVDLCRHLAEGLSANTVDVSFDISFVLKQRGGLLRTKFALVAFMDVNQRYTANSTLVQPMYVN